MGQWSDRAREVIAAVDATLPAALSFAERKAALEAVFPFGVRKGSPYKAWLRARRRYLARFGGCDPQALLKSPLWRAAQTGSRRR